MNDRTAIDISQVMKTYAQDTVILAKDVTGATLDYSEASLENIDALLQRYLANGLPHPSNRSAQDPDELWTLCKTIGGYVGEVIIRNIGGAWELRQTTGSGASIHLVVGRGIEGTPADAVRRALTEPNKSSMAAYYRTLLVALGRGERSTVNAVSHVQLPALSAQVPSNGEVEIKRPWWKLW